MFLTNKDIYETYEKIILAFDDNKKYFPAKINFSIQKNKKLLTASAKDIEDSRQGIAKQYGTPDEKDKDLYHIPPNLIEIAQKELDDLMAMQQEIPIISLSFKDIEDLEFTSNQMEAIMFMINENQVD